MLCCKQSTVSISILWCCFVVTPFSFAMDSEPEFYCSQDKPCGNEATAYQSLANNPAVKYLDLKQQEFTEDILLSFPSQIPSVRQDVFVYSPRINVWAAYNSTGQLVGMGRASGGQDWCADTNSHCRTPDGAFRIYRKGTSKCYSNTYPIGEGGAPMPYCMFFRQGYAIHGSDHVPNRPASHGCIRVRVDAAKWLHQEFIDYGSTVVVLPY
ncbi:L,D-transpeptidase [Kistimonas asteriae]|uniref:L,D-transpeptidase n=1 Tax=Kistimonas asteriae TaxID=517724 RepID=UPI001BACDB27|nr:L,D-transpeptidase [Kistimonas asteriae]